VLRKKEALSLFIHCVPEKKDATFYCNLYVYQCVHSAALLRYILNFFSQGRVKLRPPRRGYAIDRCCLYVVLSVCRWFCLRAE